MFGPGANSRHRLVECDQLQLSLSRFNYRLAACEGHPDSRPSRSHGEQAAWEQVTPIFHRWFPH